MVTYQTDRGPVRVETQSEGFYLCTLTTAQGYEWMVYVAALFRDEAVRKAIRFWYGKDPKFIKQ